MILVSFPKGKEKCSSANQDMVIWIESVCLIVEKLRKNPNVAVQIFVYIRAG